MNPIDGMLPIFKPEGMISKDVSRLLTRRFGKMKLGHVGTLDPMASGVFPILLGKATKLQDPLLALPKSYEFTIQFGIETDTLDRTGEVICEDDTPILMDAAKLESVLPQFRGEVEQTPPIYSAVKYKGRPLYDYVRKGQADLVPLDELKRTVLIDELLVLNVTQDTASLRVRCSKGTYVRVLARDIAKSLGTYGSLSAIVRSECSGRQLKDCIELDKLESESSLLQAVIPYEMLKDEVLS